MNSELIGLTQRGDVTVLSLNRPPANALSHSLLTALDDALGTLRSARAVVITGSGRFFSAGLDLGEVVSLDETSGRAFAATFDDAMFRLFALEGPVVAAINGHAIAGGAVIAAAADFRIMTNTGARLGLPEIQVGVPFPTSALEIVRAAWAGPHLATLLFRGLTYEPAAASAMNLVDEIVPPGDVLDRAVALAAELAAAPRVAFAEPKRQLRAAAVARMNEARGSGIDPIWEQWHSPEVLAAISAYRERVLGKRSPS